MGLINRILPMGVFGIVLTILLLNTLWTSGIAVGVQAHTNQSVSLTEQKHKILSEQPNITQSIYRNTTSDQRQLYKAAYGVSFETMIDAMFRYVNGGMDFGYTYPTLGTVLVKYNLPVVLPVWSYLIIKRRKIRNLIGFFR